MWYLFYHWIIALQTVLAVWHWLTQCVFILVFHTFNCLFSLFSEEDRYDSYSRMILKYFLAEGVVCRHELFVAAAQDNPDDILQVWEEGPSALSALRKDICCTVKFDFFPPRQTIQKDARMASICLLYHHPCTTVVLSKRHFWEKKLSFTF